MHCHHLKAKNLAKFDVFAYIFLVLTYINNEPSYTQVTSLHVHVVEKLTFICYIRKVRPQCLSKPLIQGQSKPLILD